MVGLPSVEDILTVLRNVEDPEAPVSIVDLGIVKEVRVLSDEGRITVTLVPTRAGCPARSFIERQVREHLAVAFPTITLECRWETSDAWSSNCITAGGARALVAFGIAAPTRPGEPVRCPYCGSLETTVSSAHGTSPCRAIRYCEACRNPFEEMKWMPETVT